MFISLSQAKYNITNGTSSIHSNIIRLHIDSLNFCRVKQRKRFSEFLQKYTDSGTETTHLPGYHILVFKYVKISYRSADFDMF